MLLDDSAYLRFWAAFQPQAMEKNKSLKLTKCASIAGQEWYHLGDAQRAEYVRESEAEWRQFQQQIKQYRESGGFQKWAEIKKTLPNKGYPKSPIAIYIRENYKEFAASFVHGLPDTQMVMRVKRICGVL